jgi:hypothetical protein
MFVFYSLYVCTLCMCCACVKALNEMNEMNALIQSQGWPHMHRAHTFFFGSRSCPCMCVSVLCPCMCELYACVCVCLLVRICTCATSHVPRSVRQVSSSSCVWVWSAYLQLYVPFALGLSNVRGYVHPPFSPFLAREHRHTHTLSLSLSFSRARARSLSLCRLVPG